MNDPGHHSGAAALRTGRQLRCPSSSCVAPIGCLGRAPSVDQSCARNPRARQQCANPCRCSPCVQVDISSDLSSIEHRGHGLECHINVPRIHLQQPVILRYPLPASGILHKYICSSVTHSPAYAVCAAGKRSSSLLRQAVPRLVEPCRGAMNASARVLCCKASESAGYCNVPVCIANEDSPGALSIHSKMEGIILPKQAMDPLLQVQQQITNRTPMMHRHTHCASDAGL